MVYDPEANVFVNTEPNPRGAIPNVMWHITDVCPLNCPYCFAPKTEQTLSPDAIHHIADTLSFLKVEKVDISGGEPLAVPIFQDVAAALAQRKVYMTVTTSGVSNRPNRRFLAESTSFFTRIILSVDGPNAELHDKLRRYPGAWEACERLIDALPASERSNRLRINTVVTSEFVSNLSAWIDMYDRIINEWGAREWCLIQPHPANRKPEFGNFAVHEDDFERVVATAIDSTLLARIITRKNTLYSSYWSIQPNGCLRQHTEDAHDRNEISLLTVAKSQLVDFVATASTELPMREPSED